MCLEEHTSEINRYGKPCLYENVYSVMHTYAFNSSILDLHQVHNLCQGQNWVTEATSRPLSEWMPCLIWTRQSLTATALFLICVSDYVYMDINNPILIWLRQYSD